MLYLNKMKFSDLIEHCTTCIKGFNPVVKTIDSHADEFISQVRQFFVGALTYSFFLSDQFTDPYEKVFIKQVFYGCTRY